MSERLRFDGPRLEALLERIQLELGPEASIVEANRVLRGGIAGFFAREWFEVVVEADVGVDVGAVAAPAGPDATSALLALAGAVHDPGPQLNGAPVAGAAPIRVGEDDGIPPAVRPDGDRGPEPPARRPERPATPSWGLPLSAAPGAIVAVVGDVAVSRDIGTRLAVRLGGRAEDVPLASAGGSSEVPAWLQVRTPEEAAGRSARWRARDVPTVVVVELVPGREGHAWACAVLESLGADQVRLVVRAWQLPDALDLKAASLGGIDGIELVELDDGVELDAFLDSRIPVAGFDGSPCTPELWATLLPGRRAGARHGEPRPAETNR